MLADRIGSAQRGDSVSTRIEIMELFSTRMRKLWNDWEIKVLILLNLALQVVLIFLGARRKFTPKLWLKIIVWGAYISTDAVAGVALGILSSKLGERNYDDHGQQLDEQAKLMAFWAPSLLLLLGGPDTITAYSLEDNELWLRHLLGLVVQTVVTAYIFIMAWAVSHLSLLELLMFMAALIKYGERVRVLWLASREKLRESMLGAPDPSPNYPRFMEDYSLKQQEGYHINVDEVDEFLQVPENLPERSNDDTSEAWELMNADRLLPIFKRLFVDLILSYDDRDLSLSIFSETTWESGFEIVAMELGFMYDLLHTKAVVIYSRWGLLRRSITLTVSISVLVSFSAALTILRPKYPTVDLVSTYLLLGVIVFLEIKSILLLASSDWTTVWLIKNQGSRLANMVSRLQLQCFKQPRTSNCFGQLKFLTFCTRHKRPPFWKILSEGLKEKADKYHNTTYHKLTGDMKEFIFSNLQEMREHGNHHYDHKGLAKSLLGEHKTLAWSTSELEFDQCLLVWHVATELCYYHDEEEEKEEMNNDMMMREGNENNKSRSIQLSRYMFYLLVRYPFLLPSGIGQIRLRDTFYEALQLFQERGLFSDDGDEASRYKRACKALIDVNTEVPPSKVKGGRSKSVLFDGCRLATRLNEIESNERWKLISKFWMQILVCAASDSRGDAHARMLSRGGELLTHVWLIMAHLGLTDHFQMTQSHAIAKLILK